MPEVKLRPEDRPSESLLENGLVVSFSLRYDHRLGILTVFISRIYGLDFSSSTTSYYIKSISLANEERGTINFCSIPLARPITQLEEESLRDADGRVQGHSQVPRVWNGTLDALVVDFTLENILHH